MNKFFNPEHYTNDPNRLKPLVRTDGFEIFEPYLVDVGIDKFELLRDRLYPFEKKFKVAIITPTYKRPELVKKVIDSVFETSNLDFDYYVYFQGYENEFVTEITEKYPIISTVSEKGVGYVPATLELIDQVLNSGIEYKYFIYLDDDAIIQHNNLVNTFEKFTNDVGAVTCRAALNCVRKKINPYVKFFHVAATFYAVRFDILQKIRDGLLDTLEMRLENNVSIEILLMRKKIFVDHYSRVDHHPQNNTHLGNTTEYKNKSTRSAIELQKKYTFATVTKNGSLYYKRQIEKLLK